MAYAAWSVIAGEQPTTSKWNILGSNDSSFNDGTGLPTFQQSFMAYRLTTQSIPSAIYTTVVFATIEQQEGSGYSATSGLYTAPRNGNYIFTSIVTILSLTLSGATVIVEIIKNGSANYKRLGSIVVSAAADYAAGGSIPLKLASGDTVGIQVYQNNGGALNTTATATHTYFAGKLVSTY